MSIGFTFTARAKKPEKLTQKAEKLAKEKGYGLSVGKNWLRFVLCPMGELFLHWEKETKVLGQWTVTGECYSTPCGAGFHKAAIDLLDELDRGALKIRSVEDETQYYEHRDFEHMKEQHFYPWLKTLVTLCGEKVASGEYSNLSICWNLHQYQPEEIPGTLVTPLGRFEAKSMVKAVETLGVRWLADRFFLWDAKEQDARYFRNSALNLMWEECCYVPSSRRESDARCNRMILELTERAAMLDPRLPLPVTAYREICALDGREPRISEDTPELEQTFPIGYRKRPVVHSYGTLQLALPGDYLEEWEDDGDGGGNSMWWNGTEESPVWRITGLRKREGSAHLSPAADRERDREQKAVPNGMVRWGWYPLEEEQKEGEEMAYQVYCEAVSGPSLFLITATYFRKEDRLLIYELLNSLKFLKNETPEEHTENYQSE